MYTVRRTPFMMPAQHLDAYLSRGWYRMGQTIFTCQFLCINEKLYSTIWTRLNLTKHQFRKGQRKLLRNNGKRFRHVIQAGSINIKKEVLYQKYRAQFKGYLSPSLRHSLLDNTDDNIYNTYEVCIYDNDKLIGFSFFDLGSKSLASIMGIYDPDYAEHSLGYYTMLLEIQYAMQNNFEHYYPGYIVPDYPKFDYKMRVGEMDYYAAKSNEWRPYKEFQYNHAPIAILKQKLNEVQHFLNRLQITNEQTIYPLYEANMLGYWEENFLEHPLFLSCFPERKDYLYCVLTYDLRKEKYIVYQCSESEELNFIFQQNTAELDNTGMVNMMFDLLIKKRQLIETDSLVEVAKAILPYRKWLF